VLDLNLEDLVF